MEALKSLYILMKYETLLTWWLQITSSLNLYSRKLLNMGCLFSVKISMPTLDALFTVFPNFALGSMQCYLLRLTNFVFPYILSLHTLSRPMNVLSSPRHIWSWFSLWNINSVLKEKSNPSIRLMQVPQLSLQHFFTDA